ncbi:MAG: hypothetical protein A2V70_05950 [Planctomycetes bacterium RBG_13_63_9]|nr:MAG: hypothetical protein A2V70_05950 [Planctomycetes bacterium RBG_13_63_9]
MSKFQDLSFSFEDFSGTVRLLPLPNLVLFPYVMQPLHIFEGRYRHLLEDALDGDRLIALATLAPGWEDDYEGRPPVYPVACLGRITTHCRLEDGTYNVLLLGLRRVRLVRELAPSGGFRRAEVEVCADYNAPHQAAAEDTLRSKLREAFMRVLPMVLESHEQLESLFDSDVPLGVLTDVISFAIDLPVEYKETLLSQTDVHRRAGMLLRHLSAASAQFESACCGPTVFPPQFSPN